MQWRGRTRQCPSDARHALRRTSCAYSPSYFLRRTLQCLPNQLTICRPPKRPVNRLSPKSKSRLLKFSARHSPNDGDPSNANIRPTFFIPQRAGTFAQTVHCRPIRRLHLPDENCVRISSDYWAGESGHRVVPRQPLVAQYVRFNFMNTILAQRSVTCGVRSGGMVRPAEPAARLVAARCHLLVWFGCLATVTGVLFRMTGLTLRDRPGEA